jgi:hypothetical protein
MPFLGPEVSEVGARWIVDFLLFLWVYNCLERVRGFNLVCVRLFLENHKY